MGLLMRDTKSIEVFLKHTQKKLKEMDLFKFLKIIANKKFDENCVCRAININFAFSW